MSSHAGLRFLFATHRVRPILWGTGWLWHSCPLPGLGIHWHGHWRLYFLRWFLTGVSLGLLHWGFSCCLGRRWTRFICCNWDHSLPACTYRRCKGWIILAFTASVNAPGFSTQLFADFHFLDSCSLFSNRGQFCSFTNRTCWVSCRTSSLGWRWYRWSRQDADAGFWHTSWFSRWWSCAGVH